MPGREVAARPAATARERRATGAPYAAETGLKAQRPQQQQPVAAAAPPCASCVKLLQHTQKLCKALEDVLANARAVFLDDTVHHQMDDERWLRVLRAVGADKRVYYRRTISPDTITPSEVVEKAVSQRKGGWTSRE